MPEPSHRERLLDSRRELEDLADEATSPTVYGLLMEAVAITTSALRYEAIPTGREAERLVERDVKEAQARGL